jgi:hypothetical protein
LTGIFAGNNGIMHAALLHKWTYPDASDASIDPRKAVYVWMQGKVIGIEPIKAVRPSIMEEAALQLKAGIL